MALKVQELLLPGWAHRQDLYAVERSISWSPAQSAGQKCLECCRSGWWATGGQGKSLAMMQSLAKPKRKTTHPPQPLWLCWSLLGPRASITGSRDISGVRGRSSLVSWCWAWLGWPLGISRSLLAGFRLGNEAGISGMSSLAGWHEALEHLQRWR